MSSTAHERVDCHIFSMGSVKIPSERAQAYIHLQSGERVAEMPGLILKRAIFTSGVEHSCLSSG